MVATVGFIGLGYIGEPMARNLIDRFETVVYDLRDEALAALVEAGAKPAASCREVGERAEVIGVCVVDDAGTEAVVAGEGGILEGAASGTVIAIHSTVHPDTVRRLAARAAEKGVHVVDAQMTGGPERTAERDLCFMVGGDPEALERCRPVLEASASSIVECGAVGSGAVAKLCNNLVRYQFWQALTEADRLAAHNGLEREKLYEVLAWILDDNSRVMMAGRNALEADPENQFLLGRFVPVMKLAEKDLDLALQVARSAGVTLPGAALCAQQMSRVYAVPDPKRR